MDQPLLSTHKSMQGRPKTLQKYGVKSHCEVSHITYSMLRKEG